MSSSSSNGKNASAGNPGELSSAETKEGKLSAEAVGEKSSAETLGENSSVETPGENSSVETPGEKSSAETLGEKSSAETAGEKSLAETLGEMSLAETAGEKSSAETQGEYSSVEIPGEISSAGIEGEKTPASINSRTEERLHKEFGEISRDPLATNMDFSLKNDNLYEWEVLIGGTPFLNGPYYSDLFILTLKFPPDYPAKIPRVTFRTTRAMSDWTLCVVNFQKLWDEAGSLSGAINALACYLLRNENSSLPKQDGK